MLRRIVLVAISLVLVFSVFPAAPTPARVMAQGDPGEITYGETVQGTISSAEGDSWFFTGSAGDTVHITVSSDVLVPAYAVYGPNSSILASSIMDGSIDSQGAVNLSISNLPSNGQYTIVVRDMNNLSGSYTLRLTEGMFVLPPTGQFPAVPPAVQFPAVPSVGGVACGADASYFTLS
ncbi:MAG: hypothetical protein GYB65_16830, partial [Chloroflexi bacterium]|nr:hypothetical protein [Chloroflexota bacterium]